MKYHGELPPPCSYQSFSEEDLKIKFESGETCDTGVPGSRTRLFAIFKELQTPFQKRPLSKQTAIASFYLHSVLICLFNTSFLKGSENL